MDCGAGRGCRATGSGPERMLPLQGAYDLAIVEAYRYGGCAGGRLAVVHPCPLLRVGARCLRMFSLSSDRRNMSLPRRRLLLRVCAHLDPAGTAVVADAVVVAAVLNPLVVDIVNIGAIHVALGTVIEEVSAVPTAAAITFAVVTEAVVDAAIEADLGPPVAIVEEVSAVAPAPITRRPKEAP